jgi:hypothetical protein
MRMKNAIDEEEHVKWMFMLREYYRGQTDYTTKTSLTLVSYRISKKGARNIRESNKPRISNKNH